MVVHDSSAYLREAVDSIIDQDLGFARTQLILVDDCTDEAILSLCGEYAEKYPDNVVSRHAEAHGISALRNEGLRAAEGSIVSFCESDDRLSPECFTMVRRFFEAHGQETDAVYISTRSYDNGIIRGKDEGMFKAGTRVADLHGEYKLMPKNVYNAFFAGDALRGLSFDERLELCSSHKLVLELVLAKMTLGVLCECSYLRRKLPNRGGTEPKKCKEYYYESYVHFYEPLLRRYTDAGEAVPPFVQNFLIKELANRYKYRYIDKGLLTFDEEKEFWDSTRFLFSHIDDDFIIGVNQFNYFRNRYLFRIKYGDAGKAISYGQNILFTHGSVVELAVNNVKLYLKKAELCSDHVTLYGELCLPVGTFEKYELKIQNGDFIKRFALTSEGTYEKMLGEDMLQYHAFTARVALKQNTDNNIKFFLLCDGKTVRIGKSNGTESDYPVTKKFRNDFYYANGWKLLPMKGSTLTVMPCSKLKLVLSTLNTIRYAVKSHKLMTYCKTKTCQLICKMPQKYIMFESLPSFGDNAWMLYDYFRKNGLLKDYEFIWYTDERDTVQREGFKTVYKENTPRGWIRYKYYNLRSKAIIFGNRFVRKERADQLQFNLGHGSCLKSVKGHYDMPRDLDYLLIQSPFFEEPTRYEHSLCDLTKTAPLGYPRNDVLVTYKPEKKPDWFTADKLIVWYPTWRQHSSNGVNTSSVAIPLIHDQSDAERINECARKNDVLILLKPHFSQDLSYLATTDMSNLKIINDSFFKDNDILSYEMLAMSSALLTDYSSVYYDYLLADKPIGLLWEDFEEYKNREGFSVDIDRICSGGEKLYTTDELCEFIENVAKGVDKLREQRREINRLANAFTDGSSTKRVAEWIASEIENFGKESEPEAAAGYDEGEDELSGESEE